MKWKKGSTIHHANFVDKIGNRRRHTMVELPDREPYEEPITKEQIANLKKMSPNISYRELLSLGNKQASVLIDLISAEKEEFGEERRKFDFLTTVIVLIVIFVMILLLFFLLLLNAV